MRAAKTTVMKYYKRHHKTVAMFWIALLFSCDTLAELDSTMESIIAATNRKAMSLLACLHASKLRFFLLVLFKRFFLFLLTSAKIMAFNWLKALFSAGVRKKKKNRL